ncbi:MAG: penicillin-binding transpeptidase domain-containing protein [Bacilli bacterium]
MRKRVTVKTSKVIIVLVALCFCAILAKLSYVVLSNKVDGVNLKEKSASITTVKKTLHSSRGSIYDINGDELAQTVNAYKVIAYLSEKRTVDEFDPQHVVDKEYTAKMLAPILGMDEADLLGRLKKDAYQVELGSKGKNITELVKSQIVALDLPGIDFITSTKRYYSMASLASYIIGYAKENENGEIIGELGIEKYYNEILAGTNGSKEYQKYTSGNYQIPNTPSIINEAKDGANIYLTIDSSIQLIAEKAVAKIAEYKTDWSVVTVMNAKTGAIVASATSPTYDPNDTNTIKNYMNPLVSYQFEPGSVMKIFSFASAIESGIYDGAKTYQSGSIDVADVTIRDSNQVGWGTISFDTGFAYSSNVAATKLALELGVPKLTSYYEALGFGSLTGIELANEVSGEIDFNYLSELASASFGQGISVTPIQMLEALSMLTNKGTTIKPYVVDKIVNNKGEIVEQGKRTEVNKVYSEETAKKMQTLMHNMVYEGLSTIWRPKNVKILGKTGTAQIASPSGGYLKGDYDYIMSFSGVFPDENPEYIMYVAEKGLHGTVRNLADAVTKAIEEIASYAKITNSASDTDTSKIVEVENYISHEVKESTDKINALKIKPIIIGDGKYVINQFPLNYSKVLVDSKIFILTNSKNFIMPDMTNWSMNEVKTFCELINLPCTFNGYGYVLTQSIPSSSVIDINTPLVIELKSK